MNIEVTEYYSTTTECYGQELVHVFEYTVSYDGGEPHRTPRAIVDYLQQRARDNGEALHINKVDGPLLS